MADTEQTWTVLRLINWTKEYFAKAGIADARLSAEMLLAHVLNCQRIMLYTRFEYAPNPDELKAFRELVARARKHEPVAYLVGVREFYSLRFKVTPAVLIPRPETELLVSEAIAHLDKLNRPGRLWDVCTGSGCVAVAVAHQVKSAEILATDLSPRAIEVAAQNVAAHDLGERVTCRQADLLALPADCGAWSQVDVLTANPPYVADGDDVAEDVHHEPREALYAGAEGLAVIRPLIEAAGGAIAPGGLLAMEFGIGQADAVRDLIVATGEFEEPRILRDHRNIERAAAAHARRQP